MIIMNVPFSIKDAFYLLIMNYQVDAQLGCTQSTPMHTQRNMPAKNKVKEDKSHGKRMKNKEKKNNPPKQSMKQHKQPPPLATRVPRKSFSKSDASRKGTIHKRCRSPIYDQS